MRFRMAKALIERAGERAAWIGDDHGDPFEAALLSHDVPIEMQIALKEILDHLRSALDYCAHEICESVTGKVTSEKIYFPITARGFAASDFRSRVGKLMPGLLQLRPDIVLIIAGFQPFANPINGWLADLATLSNQTKHVDLQVGHIDAASVQTIRAQNSGLLHIEARRPDSTLVQVTGLALFDAPNGIEGSDCRMVYLRLAQPNQDLLGFLRPAMAGVERIVRTLEASI